MDVIVFVCYKGLPQPKVTPNSSSLLLYEIFQRAINMRREVLKRRGRPSNLFGRVQNFHGMLLSSSNDAYGHQALQCE